MRILLAGGGTGGHINPAIAIAQYFMSKDAANVILFAGTPTGMEAKMVKKAGFNFTPMEIMGFSRSFKSEDIKHNIVALNTALRSSATAKRIVLDFNPDIVIGTGGYVSGPVVLAAQKLGIKTVIHEQNAFPGITTKLLSKKADIVFLAVEKAKERLTIKNKYEVVGNPVRESIVMKSKAQARKELELDSKMTVFSFGGSLGADALNIIGADIIEWNTQNPAINHIHGYGKLGREKLPQLLMERGLSINSLGCESKIHEYIDNMDTCLAAADLVICRAGAITISELQATGKAAILVPSPNVTENHQFHNAMVLKDQGACFILEESDYTKEKLINLITQLIGDREMLAEVSKKAGSLAVFDTTKRIYESIIQLVK